MPVSLRYIVKSSQCISSQRVSTQRARTVKPENQRVLNELPEVLLPPATPAAHGDALISAEFKRSAEDFRVHEQLNFPLTGTGEHLFLHLEKTARNTSDAVKFLRRCYGVSQKAVGVAGQKDKHAITTQWFSVCTPQTEEVIAARLDGDDAPPIRLLNAQRHQKKLRIGAHCANEFVIILHDVNRLNTDRDALEKRVNTLKVEGFPNYFGPQRFGAGGQNFNAAAKWLLASHAIASIPRLRRSMYLSAVRSAAFNHVLAERVRNGSWNRIRLGELCSLDGSNSLFTVTEQDMPTTEHRAQQMDVHPSAPLIGRGRTASENDARQNRASQNYALQNDDEMLASFPHLKNLEAALTQLRVDASVRATRARCDDLALSWRDERTLELRFTLAPGVFATTLLAEMMRLPAS